MFALASPTASATMQRLRTKRPFRQSLKNQGSAAAPKNIYGFFVIKGIMKSKTAFCSP
ncbi:MAG: hypothetical protein L0956_09950 [Candidatus Mariimomonas ferrooxydans]